MKECFTDSRLVIYRGLFWSFYVSVSIFAFGFGFDGDNFMLMFGPFCAHRRLPETASDDPNL